MLSAYLDDSGTHPTSDIVFVGGLAGTEWQLRSLEKAWRRLIEAPLDGTRPPLKRFHMAHCQQSQGEFTGWTRTETDYFCHQLQTIIIESGVIAYGMACSRKDWGELVTGDMRAIFGDPEGMCIRNCFIRMIGWAQHYTFDPEMTFVFDSHPLASQRDAKVAFDAFQRWVDIPHLVGVSFLSSYKILPLQAADMIAWEFYQYANDILVEGFISAKRPQYRRMASNMVWHGQLATRQSIQKMVDYIRQHDPEKLRAAAEHFMVFDPDNPDFSHLLEGQPS